MARHGQIMEAACQRFPLTFGAIRSLPDLHDVPGYGPEIMFSLLHPKTRIPAHRGSVNGRLVAHLPLIVPENCGYLRVADEKRGWETGSLLIFDDTFDHEAWNGSDEQRIILIFDVWNPQLSLPEREAFRRVLDQSARFERELLLESIFDEELPS
jgi:aspartyl/asparaginyl beta-hydroxylase (cupin superfamily)